MSKFTARQKIDMNMNRKRGIEDGLNLQGFYPVIEHWRKGKLIETYSFKNGITTEGKNLILDVMFQSATQIATASWFIGLVSSSGFSAFADADVMNSHAGWTEFTGYDESTRVAWGQGAAASASTTNSTPATFTINATGTLEGIFVTSNSTKSGTTGKLWATGAFSADVPVSNGDEMKITYTVNA